ncbi:MAG TPA: hypothetical protein ENI32_04685 [Candidatus Syntrophoarchaeum butanivorans]|uniref:Uncharacterized protein n=1 Tax=Candidatus Syntropharchaeum butanivorans TaxID=1839936 RepID=A0A1F2P5Q7_9EURY|nr:MAG: hypothetical protein SBU_000577 [Candidatus Syntrophoarchaeum butanivorans]HEC57163.1 hypothetical protein [Candidatus Syntrophoarchaeum butanivorans]
MEVRSMIDECLEEMEHKGGGADGAAAVIRCLKRHKENIYWDSDLGRLKVAAEVWQAGWEDIMRDLTEKLGISDRESYIRVKNRYNLTMY